VRQYIDGPSGETINFEKSVMLFIITSVESGRGSMGTNGFFILYFLDGMAENESLQTFVKWIDALGNKCMKRQADLSNIGLSIQRRLNQWLLKKLQEQNQDFHAQEYPHSFAK
jgi:hypothetical protein